MAIDNPLDQALEQIAAEYRQRSPFAKAILAISAAVVSGDLGAAVDALKTLGEGIGQDRAEYLLGLVIPEVMRLAEQFDRLEKRRQDYLDRDWPKLLLDAERRARETRALERIARMAKIVAGAAYANPPQPTDKTEEMIRIATTLDDADVLVLKIVDDRQGRMLDRHTARVSSYDAFGSWNSVSADARRQGILPGELDAICGKLESFGLIARGERNTNIIANDPTPFALLRRGRDFLEQVQFSADSVSASTA